MKTVSISFAGENSEELAKQFYTYMVDGGLEDIVIQQLETEAGTLEITDCNNDDLAVLFQSFTSLKEETIKA